MAQIVDYASLQTEVANRLNRSDLTSAIPGLIQTAEARLRDDPRARLLEVVDPFPVSTPVVTLPADFDALNSLDHVGPTVYGPVETVPADQLGEAFGRYGDTGAPAFAAVTTGSNGARLRLAPAPDATYDLLLTYWIKLTALSDTNTTNRLLLVRPDIYLYATLVESAPYLIEDERLAVWEGQLEQRLNAMEDATQRALYSGTLNRRPSRRF